jgi:hypothetical protein
MKFVPGPLNWQPHPPINEANRFSQVFLPLQNWLWKIIIKRCHKKPSVATTCYLINFLG